MSERTFTEVKPAGGLTFLNPKTLNDQGITGPVLEGEYLGEITNQFDGVDFKFMAEDGSTIVINGCGSLKYKLKAVKPGTFVRVDYNGMQTIESGSMKGKKAHNFTVLSADEI